MANTKISDLTAASDLVSATIPIVQSASNKKADISLFNAIYQASLTASNFGDFILALSGKTTPINSDSIVISDSEASDDAKKVSLNEFKAFLKTYNDTLYLSSTGSASIGNKIFLYNNFI